MIKITKEMEQYIKFQRTNIKDNISKRFEDSLQQDWQDIKDILPRNYFGINILDIGCGLAGIDLLFYKHYEKNAIIHLFDYNSISEKVYYGYNNEASHYNSLTLAGDFLKINGVNKKQIGLHEVHKGFPNVQPNIIISLISYGFHYPISTYLKYIKIYKDDVYKIFDIRKNTDQIKILLENFNKLEVLNEYQKYYRVLVR